MDYSSAKFGDFSFNRFGFIVRTDRVPELSMGWVDPRVRSKIFVFSGLGWVMGPK